MLNKMTKIKACQSRKNSVRIKLSQRQFGIEVKKIRNVEWYLYKMVLLKVRRIDL